jgi:hypothetical protein
MKVWIKMSCISCNDIGVFSSKEAADIEKFGFCSRTIELEVDGPRSTYRDD